MKYILRFFLLLLSGTGVVYTACAQVHEYTFRYLTVDEGLSHTDANDIVQDNKGYIWIATYFGLDRFDGYQIKKFYNDSEPLKNASKNRLNCLYPDAEGNIWIGSEDGLQCFDARSNKYIEYRGPNNKGVYGFRELYKPAGNYIYGLTGNSVKLYLLDGTVMKEQAQTAPAGVRFFQLFADKDGTLYLPSDRGLWTLDKKGRFTRIPIEGLPDERLSQVFIDRFGNLLLAAGNKLFMVRDSAQQPVYRAKGLSVVKFFSGPESLSIQSISECNSEYWLKTGSELLKLNTDLQLTQTVNDRGRYSLNSNAISAVFIDRSACLWVCTFGGGVNYCDLNQKLFFTLRHEPGEPNSLSGNHIRSVLEDGKDLWIGTTANGLKRAWKWLWTSIQT